MHILEYNILLVTYIAINTLMAIDIAIQYIARHRNYNKYIGRSQNHQYNNSIIVRIPAAKHGGKQGATSAAQDKGFVYVVPMRRKGELLQAIKQFAKEIGAGTPWSNKAERYIGLFKEAVRQDILTVKSNFEFHGTDVHLSPLERRETYLTFVDLRGMTSATTDNILQPFQSKGKC
jgi:hypothetical protein